MLPGETGAAWGAREKAAAWGNGGTGEARELSRGLIEQNLECQTEKPKGHEEAYRAWSSLSLPPLAPQETLHFVSTTLWPVDSCCPPPHPQPPVSSPGLQCFPSAVLEEAPGDHPFVQ